MQGLRVTARARPALLALVLATACHPPVLPDRKVVMRVADDIHGTHRLAGLGTAAYPRVDLDGDSRVVCTEAGPTSTIRRLLSHRVILAPGSHIRMAWGVHAEESFAAVVELSVMLASEAGTDEIARARLDGAAGDYGHWHDLELPLGDRTGTFQLEVVASSSIPWSHPSGGSEASVHLACPVISAPASAAPRRNIVLVSLDTLRADRLGIYGYERPTSPNMDRIFAAEGVVIERAIAPATKTLPSHAAMFTGLEPYVAVDGWLDEKASRLAGFPTIADVLRAHGYHTMASTENGYVSERFFGFGQGFDVFRERKGTQVNVHDPGTVEETFSRGIEWAARHRGEPFFLFLHTYQVHSPYRPLEGFRRRFPSPPDASPQRLDSDLYDAEIAQVDEAVDGLIAALDDMGVLEKTLLVVTSDHGEEFGEHGGRYHGAHLHPEVLHVPLLLRAPGLLPEGVRIDAVKSLVDLTPTLLELVGIEPPAQMTGRSRAAEIRAGSTWRPRFVQSVAVATEAETYDGIDESWRSPSLAITDWPYRMIRISTDGDADYELYDLAADPVAKNDLYGSREKLRDAVEPINAQLEALYASWPVRAKQAWAALGAAGGARPPAEAGPDASQLRELRALGYVD